MNREQLRMKIEAEMSRGNNYSPKYMLNLVSHFFESNTNDGDFLGHIILSEFGYTLEDLKSKSRKLPLPLLRALCYNKMKQDGHNDKYISMEFNKDRTTIIYSLSRLRNDIETNHPQTLDFVARFNKCLAEIS